MSLHDVGVFLESYGWPLVIAGGVAWVTWQYLKPQGPGGRIFGGQSPSALLVQRMEETFPHHPRFQHGTLNQAVEEAKRTNKMLLVYIHDQDPRNTNFDIANHVFVRDLLCSQFVAEVLQENFIRSVRVLF